MKQKSNSYIENNLVITKIGESHILKELLDTTKLPEALDSNDTDYLHIPVNALEVSSGYQVFNKLLHGIKSINYFFVKRIFFLLLMKNGCGDFVKIELTDKREFQLLCIYLFGTSKGKDLDRQFYKVNELEPILDQSIIISKYLKENYFCTNRMRSQNRSIREIPIKVNLALLDYLFHDISSYELIDYDNRLDPAFTDLIISNIDLKNKKELVLKIQVLKDISANLITLEELLGIRFSGEFKEMVEEYNKIFKKKDISIEEAERRYENLPESLRNADEEKITFISRACTKKDYIGRLSIWVFVYFRYCWLKKIIYSLEHLSDWWVFGFPNI